MNAGASPASLGFSSGLVRYFDGTVDVATTDLQSSGFGSPWGQTRSWTNGFTTNGFNGLRHPAANSARRTFSEAVLLLAADF